MRISALVFAIGMASCALATAGPPAADPSAVSWAAQSPYKQLNVVRLDTKEALDNLRSTNPRHYAIARKILAAANQICDARDAAPLRMKFAAQDVGCLSSFWLTSFPPKRSLSFKIDDTIYTALVEVRDLHAKFRAADPAWSTPLLRQPGK
jgi:hypothetical protein